MANPGPIKKVRDWLNRWKNPAVTKDKAFKRAVLISGVPGIGKTTTSALLAREAGYDVLEYNASDARSKKRLKEEGFMEIGGNRSLNEFFGSTDPAAKRNKRTLVIMDEVDGMGGGDRGGNQELIALIKKTHVPVICICNDRQKASVKTLANYCEDIRFQRPQVSDIAGRMKVIMENEGFKTIDMGALQSLCASVNNDIRQVLNLLQMLRLSTDRLDGSPESFQSSMAEGRHVELNVFSVIPQLFSGGFRSPNKALDLFFHDYDLMPLFVQENFLNAVPATKDPVHAMHLFADASDLVSYGDLVKDQVMKSQDWTLLPFLGMVSTVIPCATVRGRLSRVDFPSWLGKNSSTNKSKRVLKELQVHMSAHTSGTDKNEIRLDYIPNLLDPLLLPLEQRGQEGIEEVMALMEVYGLTKDDWESMFLLAGKEESITRLDPKLKAAFTRKYNKAQKRVAVAPVAGGKRGKGGASRLAEDDGEFLDEEVAEYNKSEEEEGDAEDDVEKDSMIKKPKKKAAPKKPKAATATAAKPKKK
jgi:replication factor C subunit 1